VNVAVVGGGLAGLCAALELSREGHAVTVYETYKDFGGLASTIEVAGTRLERFYHHVFATDLDFLDLVEELGLWDQLRWYADDKGNWYQGKTYPFSTPLEILRFPPLGPIDRLRLAMVSAWLSRVSHWEPYEKVTAEAWLRKAMGERTYKVLWEPLMVSKFGARASEICMSWFYGRVHSRFGKGKRGAPSGKLGYLHGSTQVLVDALLKELRERGVVLKSACPVEALIHENGKVKGLRSRAGEAAYDSVLATCATPLFLQFAGAALPTALRTQLEGFEYYGSCVAVLELKGPLSPHYWVNVLDKQFPFVGVIEHTKMVPASEYQGRTVLYLAKYLDPQDPFYSLPPKAVLLNYYGWLKQVLPSFDESQVLAAHVMKAEHSQPIVTVGQGSRIPPHRMPVEGLWLANMTQIYPEDRGMSYSIGMGRRVARQMMGKD